MDSYCSLISISNFSQRQNCRSSWWIAYITETVYPFPPSSWCTGHPFTPSPRHSRPPTMCPQPAPYAPVPCPTFEPCTRRQPGRGTASPRHDPAEGGSGPQPSAAAGLAQRSSGPIAHTPARSGWTQQRGHSLSEQPGAGEGTGGSEGRQLTFVFSIVK